jgi:hypothetical protein
MTDLCYESKRNNRLIIRLWFRIIRTGLTWREKNKLPINCNNIGKIYHILAPLSWILNPTFSTGKPH